MSWKIPVAVALVVAALIAGGLYFRSTHGAKLTEKDTVVLADFANTTGDAVFDGTLKQALAVDLDQSPFLRVVPPAQVQKTLGFMGRSPDERLTTDLARDLCLRVGSKAMLFRIHRQPGHAVRHHSERHQLPERRLSGSAAGGGLQQRASAVRAGRRGLEIARHAGRIAGLGAKVRCAHRAGHHGIARCAQELFPGECRVRSWPSPSASLPVLPPGRRTRPELRLGLRPHGHDLRQRRRVGNGEKSTPARHTN